MYSQLSPSSVVSNFNHISTSSMGDFHFWILTCGMGLMVLLSILVCVQTIYQLHDNREISPILAIITIAGVLMMLAGYFGFFDF